MHQMFMLHLLVRSSVENGTKWVTWMKAIELPFAPTKGTGIRLDDNLGRWEHVFGAQPDSKLTFNNRTGVFELLETLVSNIPDESWFKAFKFTQVND
jgi:hypothetical protein